MVKSMFAAVSGLRAHQTKMDTIGNNIANVNTYGYKCTRALFKDQYYATLTSSSDSTELYGGGNPSQMGYGSVINSVDRNFGRGGVATTDFATDVYIDGDGFFLVGEYNGNGYLPTSFKSSTNTTPAPTDKLNPMTSLNMTRLGDFYIDENGSLVNGNKKYAYGFRNYAPIGKEVNFNKPLDADGNLALEPATGLPAAGSTECSVLETIQVPNVVMNADGSPLEANGSYVLVQKTNGQYSFVGTPPAGVTIDATTGAVTIPGANGANNTTGYVAPMILYNISIGSDGSVSGINDLKQTVVIGKIGMASVPNSSALEAVGASEFRANGNTGVITGVTPGNGGTGLLVSSKLEMSNVDLALEFTEMITTQRGYQANTRIITVTDEMLQELVNIKR